MSKLREKWKFYACSHRGNIIESFFFSLFPPKIVSTAKCPQYARRFFFTIPWSLDFGELLVVFEPKLFELDKDIAISQIHYIPFKQIIVPSASQVKNVLAPILVAISYWNSCDNIECLLQSIYISSFNQVTIQIPPKLQYWWKIFAAFSIFNQGRWSR